MRSVTRDEQGQSLVEFALIFTVLMPVVLGIIVFGLAFNNYLEITHAANNGAQVLAFSRGGTQDVCLAATQAITAAATNLNPSNITTTINIFPPATVSTSNPNGSPCLGTPSLSPSGTGVFSCPAKGNNGSGQSYLQGTGCVQVKVTYPCNLVVYGMNLGGSNCNLTTQTAEAVQ